MKKTARFHIKTTVLLVLLFISFIQTKAFADIANSGNSQFYYDIGGARSITAPLSTGASSNTISGSAKFGFGYSCGNFNGIAGVGNIINNLDTNILTLGTEVLSGAIASLPMLIVQRASPGIYDLVQGFLIKAEGIIALANKTCEQYESDIRKKGVGAYSDWTDVSKITDWKVEMAYAKGGEDTDVNRAKKRVESNNGDNGLPWLEGKIRGGKSQKKIKVLEDIVRAGFNLSLNRNADNDTTTYGSSLSTISSDRLSSLWTGEPKAASDWAVDVLGDIHIRTYDKRAIQTRAGFGLAPKIEAKTGQVLSRLEKLVAGNTDPTIANLQDASSDALLINYDLIKAIQNLEPSERAIAVSKLASEVAMSETLEKALYIRRLLLTGMREPNVAQIPQAIAIAREAVETMTQEIDNILFEKRVRSELTSKTASIILSLQRESERRGTTNMHESAYDRNLMKDGAANK